MLRYLCSFSIVFCLASSVQAASLCYEEEGEDAVPSRTYILNPGRALFCSLDAAGTYGPNLYFNKCSKLQHQLVDPATCADNVSLEMCTDSLCAQDSVVTGLIGIAAGTSNLVSRFGRLVNLNKTCAVSSLLYCAP